MGSTPSPPPTPDPNQTAATQFDYNLKAGEAQQAASNVNQVTPYGSLTYTQTGTGPNGVPLYTATTSLSPSQQQLLDTLTGTKQTAGTQASNLLSGANYGASNPSTVIGNATSGLTSDLLKQETDYLNPFFTQQSSQLDTQLRNQGLSPGTPAYDTAMNNLRQNQNQSVTGFLAQAEPAAYSQATSSYLLPSQLAGQLSTLGSPTSPTFQTTPTNTTQPPNYTGAVANSAQIAQQNYQNQLQQNNAMMSGLFGIPTAVLGGWAGSPAGGAALSSLFAL